MRYYLTVHVYSDATFGRGAGVAGLVDVEIEHDVYGVPLIGGRALKGLLVEEWANIRFALGETSAWDSAATWLFGSSGATNAIGTAHMHIGAATLPPDLCAALRQAEFPAHETLAALTTIRRQTSVNADTGAPEVASLRAMRVLLRETALIAPLDFDADFPDKQHFMGLLAACALAVRRAGTGRNRGRGRIALRLHEQIPSDYQDRTFTHACFAGFTQEGR